MEKLRKMKPVALSVEESKLLSNHYEEIAGRKDEISGCGSYPSDIKEVIDIDDKQYQWNKDRINIIYASEHNDGPLSNSDCILDFSGALSPSKKERIIYFSRWSGISMTPESSEDTKFLDAIFSFINAFLPFLGILKDLLGTLIKSWQDFINQCRNSKDRDVLTEAHQSPTDLNSKAREIPKKKKPCTPVDNLPSKNVSNLIEMFESKSVNANSVEEAGMLIYVHSKEDNKWYQIVDEEKEIVNSMLNFKPDVNNDVGLLMPSMSDKLLLRWLNKPESNIEIGGNWGIMYVLEEI